MAAPSYSTLILRLVKLLLETGALAGASAQEVQLGTAHVGVAMNFDVLDAGGAHHKSAFYADTIAGNAAHGKVLVDTTIAFADDSTFKLLHTFVTTFFDAQEHTYIITHAQVVGKKLLTIRP